MAKDDHLSVDKIMQEYGVDDYQLFDAARNRGLPAYSKEDLEKPLDPLQVEINKAKVNEDIEKRKGFFGASRTNRIQQTVERLAMGALPCKYHISECLFKASDINKKKYGLIYSQTPTSKPLTRPELFNDKRLKDAIKTAVHMAIWIERENQKREEGQGKPKWDGEEGDDFLPEFKRFKNGQNLSGSEKDTGKLIWSAIEEYYPDLRNPNHHT